MPLDSQYGFPNSKYLRFEVWLTPQITINDTKRQGRFFSGEIEGRPF